MMIKLMKKVAGERLSIQGVSLPKILNSKAKSKPLRFFRPPGYEPSTSTTFLLVDSAGTPNWAELTSSALPRYVMWNCLPFKKL